MSENTTRIEEHKGETFIAPSSRFVGDLTLEGDAIILGTVEGTIESTGRVEIRESGIVRGAIRAGSIDLAGRVEGDVTCTAGLHVRTDGTLLGNAVAASMSAEEGAICRGQVSLGSATDAESDVGTSSNLNNEIDGLVRDTVRTIDRMSQVATSARAAAGVVRRRTDLLRTGGISRERD